MTAMRWKKAGIAAALLLSASPSAMAATLFVPTNGGVPVAQEIYGTPVITPGAAANSIRIESSGIGTFTNSEMRATFSFSGGASFNAAVPAGALTGDLNTGFGGVTPCTTPPTVTVFAGGAIGDTSVTFAVTNGSSCRALRLSLTVPGLKGTAAGTNVSLTASLLTAAGTPIDGGVINSPLVYITSTDANTGSLGTPVSAVVNLAGGGVNFIPNGTTVNATQFLSGLMREILATAFINDLLTQFNNTNSTATGKLTLTGLPAAVNGTAPTISINAGTSIATHNAGTLIGVCTDPAGAGTSVCTLSNANMIAIINAPGTSIVTSLSTVTGAALILPTTVNGKLDVLYGTAGFSTATDTKFNGTVDIIAANACAADFGSVVGSNPYGIISTLRVTNRSGQASRAWTVVSKEDGTNSGVVQFTQANTGVSAGLNVGNLLPPGATLEVRGTTLETIGFGAAGALTTADGRSRGRVRLFVETGAGVGGSVGSLGTSGNAAAGCSAEGFLCTSNAACSIMKQYEDGKDGQGISVPNK